MADKMYQVSKVTDENGRSLRQIQVQGEMENNILIQKVLVTQKYDDAKQLVCEEVDSSIQRPMKAVVKTELNFIGADRLDSVMNSFNSKEDEIRNIKRLLKFSDKGEPKSQNFMMVMGDTEIKIHEVWDETGTVSRKVQLRMPGEETETFSVVVDKDKKVLEEKIQGEEIKEFLQEIGDPYSSAGLMKEFPVRMEEVLLLNKDIKEGLKDNLTKALNEAF